MKGEQFAKIFETENGQVLVLKDYNHDDDQHQLKFGMDINGLFIDVAMASKANTNEEAKTKTQDMFDRCDLNMATEVSNMIIQQARNFNTIQK